MKWLLSRLSGVVNALAVMSVLALLAIIALPSPLLTRAQSLVRCMSSSTSGIGPSGCYGLGVVLVDQYGAPYIPSGGSGGSGGATGSVTPGGTSGTNAQAVQGINGGVPQNVQWAGQLVGLSGSLPGYATTPTFNLGTLNGVALDTTSQAIKTVLGSPFQAGGLIGNTTFGSTIADGADATLGSKNDVPSCAVGQSHLACIRQIDADVKAPTPAGTAVIGKVGVDHTTPGTTDRVVADQGAPGASPWPVADANNKSYQGAVALTVNGTAAASPYRAIAATCTAAGELSLLMADGTTLYWTVAAGYNFQPFALTKIVTSAATCSRYQGFN